MFFGANLQERRRQLSDKAGEMRERRQSNARWQQMRPFISRTSVELRLDPAARKFALGWMGEIFEVDGTRMRNASILTDQSITGQAIGGVLAGGAGILGGSAASPFQPLRSIVVRLDLDVPRFEELDFTIWESQFTVRSQTAEVRRALDTAERLARRCLSVR